MSRSLESLEPNFREKIIKLREITETEDYRYDITQTYRPVIEQAMFYCQGRTSEELQKKVDFLRKNKATFLALELEGCRAQPKKKKITKALPGEGWHSYGLAVDFHYLEKSSGRALWENKLYVPLAEAAEELGLFSGLRWKSPDAPHIQMHPFELRSQLSWKEIDDICRTANKKRKFDRMHELLPVFGG